jgi:YhcH/YjgK/YiaL family protein
MILDKIENLNNYGFDFQFIFDDLKKENFIKGKFNIQEPKCFGIGLEYATQEAEKALWEAHRKYLDIHIILDGEEIVSVTDIKNAASTKTYEDDYELFSGVPEQRLHLKPGHFLVLFPHEVHRTTEKVTESIQVLKNVYKMML